MMTEQTAKDFARKWIDSWNSHNVEDILEHYADDVEFTSPFIPLLKFNDEGIIRNKTDLKRYFEAGLNAYPDLHFKLHNHFTGMDTVVIYYTSVKGKIAAEVFQLNADSRAIKVYCNYNNEQSE